MRYQSTERMEPIARRSRWRHLSPFSIVMLPLLVAGCAVLSTVDHVKLDGDNNQIGCHTQAGFYSLSKSLLRLKIFRTTAKGMPPAYQLQEIASLRREDPHHIYCLDYRASPTAIEKVNVIKAKYTDPEIPDSSNADENRSPSPVLKQTNLLYYVSTDVIDRSRVIAQKLIKTIFRAVSGAGRSRERELLIGSTKGKEKETVFDVDFDPFDPLRTAVINDALREFGFCVMLGGFAVDLNEATIERYCDRPTSMVKKHPPRLPNGDSYSQAHRSYGTRIEKPPSGILYRPLIAYNLYIFGKKNLALPGGWRLKIKSIVQMENISPIISVGVDRSFFAQRKTTLIFDGGVLQRVCIYKTSELLELVQLPLSIVKSIVILPTQIAQFRINDVADQQRLFKAQSDLLEAQQQYLKTLRNPSPTIRPGLQLGDAGVPSTKDVTDNLSPDFFANTNNFLFGTENRRTVAGKINEGLGIDTKGNELGRCPTPKKGETIAETIAKTEEGI